MAQALHPEELAWGYTISHAGTYILTARTWLLGTEGISIDASGVTLDLQGFTLTANPDTQACISIKKGATRIRIQDGSVQGGQRAVAVGGGGSALRFQNLHIYDYSFAAIQLLPSRGVYLTNCNIGRAGAAPYGSLFGVVALPAGGFQGAERLLTTKPRETADVVGGVGLTLERVALSNITPDQATLTAEPSKDNTCPDTCFSQARRSKRWETEPCIADTGFRVNVSSCESLSQGIFPTSDLRRSQQILGDMPRGDRSVPASSAQHGSEFGLIEGAGVHAVAIFNWKDVQGLDGDTEISEPLALPRALPSARVSTAWGRSSSLLVQNDATEDAAYVEPEELVDYPLNSIYIQVSQSSRPGGAYLPGAMGSYIIC